MKLYIISENHEKHARQREQTMLRLSQYYSTSYLFAKEGAHDNIPFQYPDGAVYVGLEDVLYQVHTSVACAYIHSIANDIKNTNYELNELSTILGLYQRQPELFDIKFFQTNNEVKSATKLVMRDIRDITSNSQTYMNNGLMSQKLYSLLRFLVTGINRHTKLPAYLGQGAKLDENKYQALDLPLLSSSNRMSNDERIRLLANVQVELRNIAIAHNIRALVLQESSSSSPRNVVAALGMNHTCRANLMMPTLALPIDIPGLEILIQDGYGSLNHELDQIELINKQGVELERLRFIAFQDNKHPARNHEEIPSDDAVPKRRGSWGGGGF
ncbi:MAG: hypothetical protein CMF50_06335 [Legionellales bacterium]|nr:hypothetical protein [Legionellales bacterium]|tara:strand:+ start:469 stop:1452 length:984 start_codon:yes stop_codon:yes gene_type:complete